jgi:DNA-directed RNA polymerase subunit RPC12/RpoP
MPHAVVRNSNELDREHRRGLHIAVPAENAEEMRQGYRCMTCFEVQETPFPVRCSLCGYRMSVMQAQEFARQFEGDEDLWPTHETIREDREYSREQHAFYAREAGVKRWGRTITGLDVPSAALEEWEPPKPEYPEMTLEDWHNEPEPAGRFKRPWGSGAA